MRAHYERYWLLKKKSEKSALEKERLERSRNLLLKFTEPLHKKACDLGCGDGHFAKILVEKGACIDAVDISKNALNLFSPIENIRKVNDRVPKTKLEDEAYDIVAALDLIAELPRNEHRLFFMELSRLVTKDGWILASTPLDFGSENALDLFLNLAKTELDLKGIHLSYHRFFIHLMDFLKAPSRFHRGSIDHGYRKRSLENRTKLARWWFSLNSKKTPGALWGFFAPVSNGLLRWTKKSPKTLLFLEKAAKTLSRQHALSHVIVIGKRKPLF